MCLTENKGKPDEPVTTEVILGRVPPIPSLGLDRKVPPKATDLSPVIPRPTQVKGEVHEKVIND